MFTGIKESIEFAGAAVGLLLALVTVGGSIGVAWSSTHALYGLAATAVGGSLLFAGHQAKVLVRLRRTKSEWIQLGSRDGLGAKIREMTGDVLVSVIFAMLLGMFALNELIEAISDDTPETLVPWAVIGGLLLAYGLWVLWRHVRASIRQSRARFTDCRACEGRISSHAAVCKHCGHLLDESRLGRTRCPECDEGISMKARVCHHCGFVPVFYRQNGSIAGFAGTP